MLSKFLSTLDSWVSTPLKSGLFFWLGGVTAWLYNIVNLDVVSNLLHNLFIPGTSMIKLEWQPLWRWLNKELQPEHAALLLFIALFIMMVSSVFVTRLTFPTLRFLEGYGWLWKPFHHLAI